MPGISRCFCWCWRFLDFHLGNCYLPLSLGWGFPILRLQGCSQDPGLSDQMTALPHLRKSLVQELACDTCPRPPTTTNGPVKHSLRSLLKLQSMKSLVPAGIGKLLGRLPAPLGAILPLGRKSIPESKAGI